MINIGFRIIAVLGRGGTGWAEARQRTTQTDSIYGQRWSFPAGDGGFTYLSHHLKQIFKKPMMIVDLELRIMMSPV